MTTPAHPLDRPVWSALATRQAALSLGDTRARRFAGEFGPFAAGADHSDHSLAALVALNRAHGAMALVEAPDAPAPPGVHVIDTMPLHQMIAARLVTDESSASIVPLGAADVEAMRALAALTKPGPFSSRTHELGDFFGVRQDGVLAAMAGERMKPDGFCEVSGVCTHPDHRGRGLAGALTRHVAARIAARGETPFLHVMATNTGAIALYETLGFAIRRTFTLTVVGPAEG
jgi:predicted GNAT family acetyltransferase